ncbi:Alpha/Beta hydrolase protein [Kalaharituber pfeilii]|nr:Alpha/Beta hydrolase protein [Kalaharituber pfeilii]
MASNITITHDSIGEEITRRHLEQSLPILQLNLTAEEPPTDLYGKLKKWSKDNEATIKTAVSKKAYCGPYGSNINWECTFLAFMESITMYLRDYPTPNPPATTADAALEQIEAVAKLWGMGFDLYCDMVEKTPVDTTKPYNGAYCGGFYSLDDKNPFIGVAFKGTNAARAGEVNVNKAYKTISEEGYVFGTSVSEGVFTGLFKPFKDTPVIPAILTLPVPTPKEEIAYDLIHKGLNNRIKLYGNKSVRVHVTGHSLGGSYANLCFAQLLQDLGSTNPQPPAKGLGDLYTFGCPRIGLLNFGLAIPKHLKLHKATTGSSWRIANRGDLVPEIPPTSESDEIFFHLDVEYKISNECYVEHIHTKPKKIKSEITKLDARVAGKSTAELWIMVLTNEKHGPDSYHASLKKALEK